MATLDDALAALDDSTETLADTQAKPSFEMPMVKAAPAKPATGTLYDALDVLEQPERADQLRGAVELGTKQDPARSTKILQLFGKTGLPRDFIERNQDFVEQESAKQDFDPERLMKDSPAFASWLSEHPDHVAAAMPNAKELSFIEKQLRNIPAQFEQGKRTVEYGDVMLGIVDGLLSKGDITGLRKRQAELEAEMAKPDETGLADETGISGVAQRAPGWVAQQLPILGRTLQDQFKSAAVGTAGGALLGGAVGGPPGALAGGLAVGGAMWRIGAAVSAAKMEMGHAYGDFEKLKDENGQPLDQNTAIGLAGVVGVINGAVEGFFGIEGLTSKLPGINQFTRQGVKELLKTPTTRAALLSAARTIGQTMVTEGATEALQMYITKAGGVALQALKDGGSPADWLGKVFSEENFKQALTEAEAGAMGGGGIAAIMTAPQVVADIAKVKEANRTKAAFESIGKATESAKFAQDLPDSLKAIISRATKDGPIEQVYVPAESFNTYFQKEGVDPRAVYQEITGNVDAYDQAVQTGADLPIDTADYATKLAGTKHNEFFVNELRASVDAMNAREAEQWVKDQDAQAEAEAAAIAQPGIQTMNADPAGQVRKDIAGQLQAAGFDPTVVDQYAGLFESRYRARAERRGLGETAADLFRQNNLTISKGDVAVSQASPVTGFKTAKGSTYSIEPDGRTTRNKAARPEHPGDEGIQPSSEQTFYVDDAGLNALSEFQTKGAGARKIVKIEDGSYGIQYTEGKDAGKIERRTVVKPAAGPAVGLTPVELWKAGSRVHFGNKITELLNKPTQQTLPGAEGQTFMQGGKETTLSKLLDELPDALARRITRLQDQFAIAKEASRTGDDTGAAVDDMGYIKEAINQAKEEAATKQVPPVDITEERIAEVKAEMRSISDGIDNAFAGDVDRALSGSTDEEMDAVSVAFPEDTDSHIISKMSGLLDELRTLRIERAIAKLQDKGNTLFQAGAAGQTFAQSANIDPMATEQGPGSQENAQTPHEPGRETINVTIEDGEYSRLPVEEVIDESLPWKGPSQIVDLLPGGHLRFTWRGWGMLNHEVTSFLKDAVFDQVELASRVDPPGTFWRFTNDKAELARVKDGSLKPSLNHRDSFREKGISVSDTPAYSMAGYKYGYRVTGDVIGSGSDGEPIIDPSTIKAVDKKVRTPSEIDSEWLPKKREARREYLKSIGWTEEHYKASQNGFNLLSTEEFRKRFASPNPSSPQQGGLNTLLQTFNEGDQPKGSITFGDGQINIKLLEKADLSTFLHESGHLYLNELITDATTPGVSTQLTSDLDTILAWLKLDVRVADGADAINGAIKTKHHEQFARGFEAYTMEGKSPSQAMREAFATFRQWLIQAYKSLTTAPLNVKLTKDVREVMDRMIATDEEIDAAAQEAEIHPLFTTSEMAGMSKIEFEAYRETVKQASLTARETLQKQLMAQYQRKHEKWWKTELEATQLKVLERVNDQPEYVALSVLQTGTMPDGSALPAGIEPMKLDRKAIADQFGADFLATMPKGTMRKNGMHPDTAAPLFGFNSGQEMIMAMVNARPKFDLVNAQADQQMQDKYGDMRFDGSIAEAARAAVMNEHQEKVIAAEIRALNAKAREVKPFVKAAENEAKAEQRAGKALLRTMIPSLEDTRTLARNILSRMTLKKLNPYSYSVAARQASKRATEALASDDYIDAGLHKQRELLNLAMFREALIIKEQIEKTHDLASNFGKADKTLAKSRNVDLINVGRAILAQYGLGPEVDKTAAEHLDPIKNYDKDLYDQWKPQVDALAPRPLDYNALTVEEFLKLDDNLKALWLLSLRTQQIKVNGELVDRNQVIDELAAVMGSFTTQQKSKVVGAQTPWADTKLGLLSWRSALSRVESWVDAMDSGDINGVFRKVVWTPISEASNQFRAGKRDLIQKYLAIIKPIEGTITRDLIAAPELGTGVTFRGKTALLHAILHTGNESNQSKLLRGYNWDPSAWQTFIDRMHREKVLTKADYDYAQGVWDLLESIKPQAQQAHHEMYGYYFSEITAKEFDTPWGKYKGGYVPAIADRVQSVDQAIREEKDLFDQAGNSYMFPTTGKGFTKSRVEEYAAPLALDLTTIPLHLDKTMRFVHLEPRVKDAARLITNKRLRSALDAMDSTAAKDMLVPWLQRSAQQTVSTPGRNRHADKMFRYLRKTAGAQIMVGNVLNTLQQFTGFSLSLTKVKARYMRGAMVNYLRHPSVYAQDISERSAFMKGRTSTQVMEIQSTIDDILLNPTKYEKARKFAERHGYFMQQGTQSLVDLVTWGAAYDQAHAQNLDETMAVRAADAAVRQTQGSFAPEDLSNFEAGTPFTRAFTMFYSYFNMQANLLGTEFGKVANGVGLKKGAGRAFYLYFVGFLIPAVLAETIVKGMGGFDPDDDDDYLNEALSVFFGSQLRSALAFFPGVGPITLAGINAFNDKWYDDRISTSPVVSALESAVRAPHSLYKAMSEDGHSKRAVRDVLTLLGLVTGLPAGSLARPLGYLADVNDGKANPEDAGDVARGLLSGRDVNRQR